MTQALYRRTDRPAMDVVLSTSIPHSCLAALARLAARVLAARARGDDASHVATSLSDLKAAGLSTDDCLALISYGLLESQPVSCCAPARRHPARGEGVLRRSPRSIAKHTHLGPHSQLLLTDLGLALITKHAQSASSDSPPLTPSVRLSPLLPHYDSEARELTVVDVVILRLPAQARSLAAVLNALELCGWKRRVVKPLTGRPGGNDPHHLAIAAYKLNARQSLIKFHADDGAFRWNWRPNIDRKVIEE